VMMIPRARERERAREKGKIERMTDSSERDSLLTTDEAIEYLKISKPTFLKYIRLGRIRAVKAGKGWRILQSELNRFLKGRKTLRKPLTNRHRSCFINGRSDSI